MVLPGPLLRVLVAAGVVAAAVGGALALQRLVRDDVTPRPPIWARPLEGPWDGTAGSPPLEEACRRLLAAGLAGDAGALRRLDRRLEVLGRETGDHPLAHVDAWRSLFRERAAARVPPAPGLRSVDLPSDLPGGRRVRYALGVPGAIRAAPAAVVISLPAPGEDPEEHLRRRWSGAAEDVLLLAPERPADGLPHPGLLLLPLRHVRETWARGRRPHRRGRAGRSGGGGRATGRVLHGSLRGTGPRVGLPPGLRDSPQSRPAAHAPSAARPPRAAGRDRLVAAGAARPVPGPDRLEHRPAPRRGPRLVDPRDAPGRERGVRSCPSGDPAGEPHPPPDPGCPAAAGAPQRPARRPGPDGGAPRERGSDRVPHADAQRPAGRRRGGGAGGIAGRCFRSSSTSRSGEGQRPQGDARRAWSLVAAMVARGSGLPLERRRRRSRHPKAVPPLPRSCSCPGFERPPATCGSGARRTANGTRATRRGRERSGRRWSLGALGCRSNGQQRPSAVAPHRGRGAAAPSGLGGRVRRVSGCLRQRRTAERRNGARATRGRAWAARSGGGRSGLWAAARTATAVVAPHRGPWRRCLSQTAV
jgi:hypothetical protein